MRLGVISDVHGNLPALEATLDRLETDHDVSAIVCLGDTVGVMGWPRACVRRVRDACTAVVVGNHDRGVLPEMDLWDALENGVTEREYAFVTDRLETEDFEWLWALPETTCVPPKGPRAEQALLVHSHPDEEVRWSRDDYVTTGMFVEMGAYTEGGTLLLGHLHEQHAVDLEKFAGQSGLVVNPGSVGQPHDGRAEYAVVDTATQEYDLHTAEFSTDRVVARMRDVGTYDLLP